MATHSTRIKELLAPLKESILNKPHYISGRLQLTTPCFSLFYKLTKDGPAARHINLANATFNDLEQLAQTCQPDSLGVVQEGVTNELCYEVRTMHPEYFASQLAPDQTPLVKLIEDYLFEGSQSQKTRIELRELNVYSVYLVVMYHQKPGETEFLFSSGFILKALHRDPGGALLVWHRSREWSFDPSREYMTTRTPKIGYVVLLNDFKHEVTPVTSGHRVTLTYNLYREVVGSVSAQDPAGGHYSLPEHGRAFRDSFETLLENPEFFPYGGMLAFGLRHRYPIRREIKHVYGLLKANDAVVYWSLRALGFQPALYFYHGWSETPDCLEDGTIEGGLIDHVLRFQDFDEEADEGVDITREILEDGGHVVCGNDLYRSQKYAYKDAETMEWATPMTTFSSMECTYTAYGNEAREQVAYWDLCLVVRIGKAGERLMYRTLSQLEKDRDWDDDDRDSPFWFRM